jgi:serine/threonine protein phosphatase PrpC
MIIQYFTQLSMTMQGKSHKTQLPMTPCQDSVFYEGKNNLHIMVVSDGAGSQKLSHIGSNVVVRSVGRFVRDHFNELLSSFEPFKFNEKEHERLKKELLKFTISKLEEVVKKENLSSIKELASTLVFVAFNEEFYLHGHIGDGLVIASHQEKSRMSFELLSEPFKGGKDVGEASTETKMVTSSDAFNHFRMGMGHMHMVKGFLITSDGIEDKLINNNRFTGEGEKNLNKWMELPAEQLKNTITEWVDADENITDDIGICVINLLNLSTQSASKDQIAALLNPIKSEEQIIVLGPKVYFVDPIQPYRKVDFESYKDALTFMEKNNEF